MSFGQRYVLGFDRLLYGARQIDDPDLEVDTDSVLVLQDIGPIGNPGMPEAGLIPIPRKLAQSGVEDMLRLSDGRMSGTAGGIIVLHISPESVDPQSILGVVKTSDLIECNVTERLLQLHVPSEEIALRIKFRDADDEGNGRAAAQHMRGYLELYKRSVNQGHLGADFDFLTSKWT